MTALKTASLKSLKQISAVDKYPKDYSQKIAHKLNAKYWYSKNNIHITSNDFTDSFDVKILCINIKVLIF